MTSNMIPVPCNKPVNPISDETGENNKTVKQAPYSSCIFQNMQYCSGTQIDLRPGIVNNGITVLLLQSGYPDKLCPFLRLQGNKPETVPLIPFP
jgi:hypothetical protein